MIISILFLNYWVLMIKPKNGEVVIENTSVHKISSRRHLNAP